MKYRDHRSVLLSVTMRQGGVNNPGKNGEVIYGWPLCGVTFTHNNTEAIGRGQIRKMHILWQKIIHLTFVKITSLRDSDSK